MTEVTKIEKFGVGNLYPDSNPPEFSFFKRTACNVELDDDGKITKLRERIRFKGINIKDFKNV